MFRKHLLDTISDTNKKPVSLNKSFILHSYENKDGEVQVMLSVTRNGRVRIGLKVYGRKDLWNKNRQRFKEINKEYKDKNVLLSHYEAKANNIIVEARLNNVDLNLDSFRTRFESDLYSNDFIEFLLAALKLEEEELSPGTYRRYLSVSNKLKEMYGSINISSIDHLWIDQFRKKLRERGNKATTIASNLNVIKKFLNIAKKYKFFLNIEPNDIVSGDMKGEKVVLTPAEVKHMIDYYFSPFISEEHSLILGYFLCGCYLGLRYGDLISLDREDVLKGSLEYVPQKTKRYNPQTKLLVISKRTMDIILETPLLFIKKLTNEYINRELKKIARQLGINKNLTFHVSRHTFATSFLRAGGDIHQLKILMDHSKVEQTMEYVHITQQEVASKINIMDDAY